MSNTNINPTPAPPQPTQTQQLPQTSSSSSTPKSVWPVLELPENPRVIFDHDDDDEEEGKQDDNAKTRSSVVDASAVESLMNYCSDHVTHMQTRRDLGGTDSELEGASWNPCRLLIHNGRKRMLGNNNAHSLDRNGFQLVSSPVVVLEENNTDAASSIDYKNSQDVINRYYHHCEQLLLQNKEIYGQTKNKKNPPQPAIVKAFDHNIRVSDSKLHDRVGDTTLQQPIGVVHNDYTHISAPRRLEQLGQPPKANDSIQKKEKQSLLDPQIVSECLEGKRRYVFLNVWRNIQPNGTLIQQFPLACVDATTTATTSTIGQDDDDDDDELLTFQIIYKDRIGENYFSKYNPKHEWNYFPQMNQDEVILIKQWDSHGSLALSKNNNNNNNNGDFVSTFSLHSAFQDPTSPKDAPPRESIEVRCVLIWDLIKKEEEEEEEKQ